MLISQGVELELDGRVTDYELALIGVEKLEVLPQHEEMFRQVMSGESRHDLGFGGPATVVAMASQPFWVGVSGDDVAEDLEALLTIPWFTLILGWTYLINDQKITAIGQYIRHTLTENIKTNTSNPDLESLFGWEIAHRSDPRRSRRKIEQLIIDQITFVFSGIIALITFFLLVPKPAPALYLLGALELIFLLILATEITLYADLAKGR
ncbi:MAG: hypothetical protein HC771_23640 [Synechococcales cyanobacterium CRU_2_2]|nr:hypothetical protein [Synechococcales cyanobacterium CRU_2_2]